MHINAPADLLQKAGPDLAQQQVQARGLVEPTLSYPPELPVSLAREEIPLPLKHTEVKAGVIGYIATVDVTQQFHNPFDTKIEAKYVFPLPQNAAKPRTSEVST